MADATDATNATDAADSTMIPAARAPHTPRGRHVRKLVVPIVLAVALIASASALVTTGVGCGGDDGPSPDGHPGDGQPDTPII